MSARQGAFARGVAWLSLVGAYLAAAALVAILLLVSAEILMRGLFGQSTQISDEFSEYLNAALIFFGLGYALRERQFIRIEIVYDRLRGRVLRAAKWIILWCSISYVSVLIYYVSSQVEYLYSAHVVAPSLSQVPLYLPQLAMPIGCIILLLQLLAFVFRPKEEMP